MLYFNSEKFDFWKVYDAIKHFYPIGIERDESKMYFSYPGLKELENIMIDNIHNESHFTERWLNFIEGIEKEIGKEIIDTTYGQAPSFSSFVLLDTTSINNLTRTKELHFFVSLVGSFYTVIGQDTNTVKPDEHHNFRSINYLITSPTIEFENTFTLLCDKIENRFKGFRFVPFLICKQTIDGLYVRYSDENLNSVFHALFNNHIDLIIQRIGNDYYKSEDWIKAGYVDTGEVWKAFSTTLS